MCLIALADEKVMSTYSAALRGADGNYAVVPPPLYLDVYIAFIANFYNQNYRTISALSRPRRPCV
jgi:hypothetical protein